MKFIALTLALVSISAVAVNAAEPTKTEAAETTPDVGAKPADEVKE